MNPELARQHAHIAAVRARIATGRLPAPPASPAPGAHASAVDLGTHHYDHVRVWRRVERARREKGPRVEDVVDAACDAWGVSPDAVLRSRSMRPEPTRRRQVVAYLCRELVRGASLPDIGARLHRDHTVVLHAHRKVAAMLARGEADVAAKVAEVRAYLGLSLDALTEPQ